MQTKTIIRKRIWEVDCLSLNAALAASFDWKDLSNFLTSHGICVDHSLPEHILEMQIQNTIHKACHQGTALSRVVETRLNDLYEDIMCQIEGMSHCEIGTIIANIDFAKPNRLGGFFWALGSDSREGMECVRHFLHERSQMALLRKSRILGLVGTVGGA